MWELSAAAGTGKEELERKCPGHTVGITLVHRLKWPQGRAWKHRCCAYSVQRSSVDNSAPGEGIEFPKYFPRTGRT